MVSVNLEVNKAFHNVFGYYLDTYLTEQNIKLDEFNFYHQIDFVNYFPSVYDSSDNKVDWFSVCDDFFIDNFSNVFYRGLLKSFPTLVNSDAVNWWVEYFYKPLYVKHLGNDEKNILSSLYLLPVIVLFGGADSDVDFVKRIVKYVPLKNFVELYFVRKLFHPSPAVAEILTDSILNIGDEDTSFDVFISSDNHTGHVIPRDNIQVPKNTSFYTEEYLRQEAKLMGSYSDEDLKLLATGFDNPFYSKELFKKLAHAKIADGGSAFQQIEGRSRISLSNQQAEWLHEVLVERKEFLSEEDYYNEITFWIPYARAVLDDLSLGTEIRQKFYIFLKNSDATTGGLFSNNIPYVMDVPLGEDVSWSASQFVKDWFEDATANVESIEKIFNIKNPELLEKIWGYWKEYYDSFVPSEQKRLSNIIKAISIHPAVSDKVRDDIGMCFIRSEKGLFNEVESFSRMLKSISYSTVQEEFVKNNEYSEFVDGLRSVDYRIALREGFFSFWLEFSLYYQSYSCKMKESFIKELKCFLEQKTGQKYEEVFNLEVPVAEQKQFLEILYANNALKK